ncbi:MAG: hypothetical protein DME20_00910 [Verrucomicrobia bacterium]|nr:MAG: hypothetical protein DME71_04855 [Verrucomicrobiota bacterium]PYK51743.1 MAG: hypothetical protein DME20_00910 [Verrucomicrobiota bacterium]
MVGARAQELPEKQGPTSDEERKRLSRSAWLVQGSSKPWTQENLPLGSRAKGLWHLSLRLWRPIRSGTMIFRRHTFSKFR